MKPSAYIKLMLNVLVLSTLSACAGRSQFEEQSQKTDVTVSLSYVESVIDSELILEGAKLRTMVRAYPVVKGKRLEQPAGEVFVERELSDGYDHEVEIQLEPGEYEIWAWSDFTDGAQIFYDTRDFSSVYIAGEHIGSTFLRDSFYGSAGVEVSVEGESAGAQVYMDRPVARFALISDDLIEFISRQALSTGKEVNLDEYTALICYVGFMPDTFSLFTGRPVDSATGVTFRSPLKQLSESEVLLGFDYVFVTDKDSAVTVRVALLDSKGEQVSLTGSIKVPLKRNTLTVLRGSYMNQASSDWLQIDPDYDGDFNMYI